MVGFTWRYGASTFTTEGIQERIEVVKENSAPWLIFWSKPCERTCEAKESVLVHALRYINEVLGYEMYDVHFTEYMSKRVAMIGF